MAPGIGARALALALLLAGAPGLCAADEPEWTIEKFTWNGPMESASRLEATNLYGDLRTRDSTSGELEVLANIQRHPDDPLEPEVVIEATTHGVRLEVVYRPRDPAAADWLEGQTPRGRVDVALLVPGGVDLVASTKAGLLEIKGIQGTIDARTVGGDLKIISNGSVRTRTEHGEQSLLFRTATWVGDSKLQSTSGGISVSFPPDAKVSVTARTMGHLTTDYSIEIERPGDGRVKEATATLGAGGSKLELTSEIGDVRLLESHR